MLDADRSPTSPMRKKLVVAALVPLATWSASLLFSYVIQDFTCTALDAAGMTISETPLRAVLVGLNVVLVVLTLVAGVLGLVWSRRHRLERVDQFLAFMAAGNAALFGFAIVMIGASSVVLEVCT